MNSNREKSDLSGGALSAVRLDVTSSPYGEEVVSAQDVRDFLDSLNLSSDVTDDENNWSAEENGSGVPVFDELQDIGRLKDNLSTDDRDRKKDITSRTRKRNEEVLKKLPKAAVHHEIFYGVLNDILNWDIGIGTALDRMSLELEEAELPSIQSNAFNSFEKTKSRMESLMLMRGFIRASGLVEYENSIMQEYISKVFENTGTSVKEFLNGYGK